MSRAFGGVIIMALLLGVYIFLLGQKAVLLMISGVPTGIAIGIALAVMPLVATWAVWRELSFGAKSSRLYKELLWREEAEDAAAAEENPGMSIPNRVLPTRPSGRVDRAAADEAFPLYKEEAEAHPDDWAVWFRLGLAYDACGDRRRARQAIRRAIVLNTGDDS